MKKSNTGKYTIEFFKFTFKLYPKYYVILFLNSLFYAILAIYNSYILSIILYSIETYSFQKTIIVSLFISIISFVLIVISHFFKKSVRIEQCKIREKIDHIIVHQLTKIPYEYLEDEYYLDMIKKAKYSINDDNCINNLFTSSTEILQCICTLISLFLIIASFSPLLVLVLLVGLVLNSLVINYLTKLTIKFNDDNISIDRKFDYYLDTLLNEKYGKDFRLYSIGNVLLKKYHEFINDMLKIVRNFERKTALGKNISDIVKYIEMALIYLIIVFIVIKRGLSVSSFTLYVTASTNFSNTFSILFKQRMKFLSNSKLIVPLMSLLNIKVNNKNEEKNILNRFHSLEFKNVSFHYPNTDRIILDNISFRINSGDKISIVGLNGAGKTTIVKLICRLYQPTKGVILINDISITAFEEKSYSDMFSALFQDFKIFPFTIKDNIQTCREISDKNICSIIDEIGLNDKIDACRLGINTICSRAFDKNGTEFSGGEAQKLAFGRVLASSSDLVILDEPTSAYDPITEAKFYEDFSNLLIDRTIIFISHRMSSSVFSDKILLVNNGKIEAFDTHENLVRNKDSLYYKLFAAQAENYNVCVK